MGDTIMAGNNNGHCADHSETKFAIKVHTDQITDLYKKHNDVKDILSDIKTSIATMQLTMNNGFASANEKLEDVSSEIKTMGIVREETLAFYDGVVKKFDERLDKLEDFEWFRRKMNRMRDCLPDFVLWVILGGLVLFAAFNWAKLGELLNKKIGG